MKRSYALLAAGAPLLVHAQAHAWASANRFGGSTTHSWGETSRTNAWCGSTYGAYGEGGGPTYAGGGSVHGYGGYSAYHPPVLCRPTRRAALAAHPPPERSWAWAPPPRPSPWWG